MRIAQRFGAISLSALVMTALLALPASAQAETVETRRESYIATAAARGLNLGIFGTNVTIGQSSAVVDNSPSAKASGAGVALVAGTVSTSEVDAANESATPPKACVLNLPVNLPAVGEVLSLELACGESRVLITPEGAPSAFGSGSVGNVDLDALGLLDPVIALLQSLLSQLLPVVDQTVGTVVNTLPAVGGIVGPLAGSLGLGSTSTVAPVSSLVDNLLQGIQQATSLVDISLGASTAEAVTTASAVTATAKAAGAQIDLLPGLTVGGAPLLSILVGDATSVSSFGRETAESTTEFDAAVVRVRLGLPLLGGGVTDIPVRLGEPLTLLAGTPLESTISLGAGRKVINPGAVASYADGVSVHLLKGVSGGILLELAHAETGAGGQTRLVTQQVAPPAPILAKTGNDPWLPLTGAGLLMVALAVRRRVAAAQPARTDER